ncbi:MAG: hypothetical protein ACYTGG_01815 [Planctomycetota bacterium]
MKQDEAERPLLMWSGMVAACVCTLIFSVASVRIILEEAESERSTVAARRAVDSSVGAPFGVRGRLTAGDVTVERSLPAMSFAVRAGETLDARLPEGPFTATFTVRFRPGTVREARLGADLQGGSLIIRRRGEVLLSTYVGDERETVLTTVPASMSGRSVEVEFEFTADDSDVHALRALWEPSGSMIPLPLPSTGAPLLAGAELQGESLVQQFNCVACHASHDPARQQRLATSPGPVLGDIGARVRPSWIRAWVEDPRSILPGTAMPRLHHGQPTDAEQIEDLTHYLVSLGGPIDLAEPAAPAELVRTGRAVYHEVGCFACHGALETPETFGRVSAVRSATRKTYVPLGDAASKTTVRNLAAFLQDPLATRPSGRMPSLDLTGVEAEAVASYLVSRDDPQRQESGDESFQVDPVRAARGATLFAGLGCANCHDLGPNRSPVASTLSAPALESLAIEAGGCLDDLPTNGVPQFELHEVEARAIETYLAGLPFRRSERVPIDELALSMTRLDCVACHEVYGAQGPEPALLSYFSTRGEADLGDEGRLPPSLTDVAARLNGPWLREVLEGDARARPYLAARMPKYGELNVRSLPSGLMAAAGVTTSVDHGPRFDGKAAVVGRLLVGGAAMNCIQCHDVAGNDSTGTPGPDLALATERLRYRAFSRWLHDPSNVRPGTRMPSFFVNGYSGFTEHLGGRAQDQVDAVWSYLSQGEHLPLPDGLTGAAGLQLVVEDEPIVFRTFMSEAGVRAIAVGFPEQIHCAWDADQCRIATAWQGQFLDASGAWAARGGSETDPQNVVWTAPPQPLLAASSESGREGRARRFRGYRLDEQRRPIFRYDLFVEDGAVSVEDQPIAEAADGQVGPRLLRRLVLSGEAGLRVAVDPAGHRVRSAPDGRVDRGDGSFEVVLGAEPVVIMLEVTW